MRYKILGKTGLNVSVATVGTWAIGGSGWGAVDRADSIKAIRKDEWLQNYKTYKFGTPTVKDYCRYSDTLYSVRMIMDLNVIRTDNTTKTFSLDTTYFVETVGTKQGIVDMTNVDITEVFTQVRLTCTVDGKVVSSQMLDNDTSRLQLPTVEHDLSLRGNDQQGSGRSDHGHQDIGQNLQKSFLHGMTSG